VSVWLLLGLSAGVDALTALGLQRRRSNPDDPIQVDDDRAFDASAVSLIEGTNAHDFVENTFFKRGERADIPALNVKDHIRSARQPGNGEPC
jgi:hypothetical protein